MAKATFGKLSEVPFNEISHCSLLCVGKNYHCLLCLGTHTGSVLPPFSSPLLIFQILLLILRFPSEASSTISLIN